MAFRGPAFAGISAALCQGCTVTLPADGPTREIISVGITRIVVPERKGNLVAFRRSSLGLGFGDATASAVWAGFDSSEWVIADPAKCQLLVVIREDVEAENAARILESLKGENVCYVKDM
jgi:hypothetical protein